MIEKYYFAWVTADEEFDKNKHAKKELSVLKLHVTQKKGELFAQVKLLLPTMGEIPADKFLFISVDSANGIMPVVKCRPVSVSHGKWDNSIGFIMELHAKSYKFDSELEEGRRKNNFDYRFLLNTSENKLIDFRLMVDRQTLKLNVYDYADAKREASNQISSFFPLTVLNYQKNPGVRQLKAILKLNWTYKDEQKIDIGSKCLEGISFPNAKVDEINKNLVPIGSMYGECAVVSAKLNDIFFSFEGTSDNLVAKPLLDLSIILNWNKKIARNELVVLNVHSGVDDKKCNVVDQDISFNISLDEYVAHVARWNKDVDYSKNDIIAYYGKRYKCVADHRSSTWDRDQDQWECLVEAFLTEQELSVACQPYGYKLVESALEIIKQFLLYTNHSFITKVQVPLEQLLSLKYGEYAWLEREFCERSGCVTLWELYADDTKTHGWVELSTMLSLKKPVELKASEDDRVFAADYCEEGYACVPKVIKTHGFQYHDYAAQFPHESAFGIDAALLIKKAKKQEVNGLVNVYTEMEHETARRENVIMVDVERVANEG